MDPLRDDPRFREMIKRLNLPEMNLNHELSPNFLLSLGRARCPLEQYQTSAGIYSVHDGDESAE